MPVNNLFKAGVVGATILGVVLLATRAMAAADIQLTNLVISPGEVQVGQPVTISVDATNIGQTAGNYTVTLEVI